MISLKRNHDYFPLLRRSLAGPRLAHPSRLMFSLVRLLTAGIAGMMMGTTSSQAASSQDSFQGKIGYSAKDSIPAWPQTVKPNPGAPNVVLILLDDAGYANTSTFGGPARTPTLDRLAKEGLRYNRFHVSAICSSTRAALLSGRNDHRIGFGVTNDIAAGFPGYHGRWPKSAASLAEVLRRNGYNTGAFGKWHNTPSYEINPLGPFDRWPTGLGFNFFYGFMGGAVSQWEPPLYRNTLPVDAPKSREEGYHFTTDIADQAISWVHTHQSLAPEKPFFLYFATGATHFPHHVPPEWIEQYRGEFDQGWDKMREDVFARQKQLGVIPPDTELTPRPQEMPAWDSLSADQRTLLARQMEVEAAFMTHTDHEIGRLIEAVQQGPGGENTLILYITGDNGGDLEAGDVGRDAPGPLDNRLQHIDDLGSDKSFNAFGAGWGWATGSPFKWGKFIASHLGGISNPMVVSWPAGIKDTGGVRSQFTHANDVAATIYEVAGISPPATVDGVEQLPLDGTSFAYSFDQPDAPSRHRMQIFEQLGNRSIYHDGWMASARHVVPWIFPTRYTTDFHDDEWELYHLDEDFSQARNLAREYPEKLNELRTLFEKEAWKNNIYPLGPKSAESDTWLVKGRKDFTYTPDLPRLPGWAAPAFDVDHRIVVKMNVPPEGVEGVIVSNGSRFSGFVLYARDNYLVYENHATPIDFAGGHDIIRSDRPLPEGEVEVTYEFIRDVASTDSKRRVSGIGRLYINQQLVGESHLARLPSAGHVAGLGTFNIGQDRVAPVSTHYELPFKFTGRLEKVSVQLK